VNYEPSMITETERRQYLDTMAYLLDVLRRLDYMTPYSYKDIFHDESARELTLLIFRKLDDITKTYITSPLV
jgi:hypothetical protein